MRTVRGSEVHIRRGTCDNAKKFVYGLIRWDTAAAFSIVLHEAMHRQGVKTERAANCLANDGVFWAGKYFGYSAQEAEKARVLAFNYANRTAAPEYRMSRFECLKIVSRYGISWWGIVQTPRLEKIFQ
jgi:hypothetical protein